MVARKIDDKDPLGFGVTGADVGGMNKVVDESEIFEGRIGEKATIPQLGMESTRVNTVWDPCRT